MNTKRLILFALLAAAATNLTSASLAQVSSESLLANIEENNFAELEALTSMVDKSTEDKEQTKLNHPSKSAASSIKEGLSKAKKAAGNVINKAKTAITSKLGKNHTESINEKHRQQKDNDNQGWNPFSLVYSDAAKEANVAKISRMI